MTITSGQLPINPLDGTMPSDIAEQARQSLENVKAIVEAAGLTVGQIVKTTVFVKDLQDFAAINAAYEAFFTEHQAAFPARSCVEVARLPKDAGVEIESHRLRSLISGWGKTSSLLPHRFFRRSSLLILQALYDEI